MSKSNKLTVQKIDISVSSVNNEDYFSLTDIAKYRNQSEPFSIINNWMRGRTTLAFLGLWEVLNNVAFKPLEFERFKSEAGHNYFVLSPQKWIEKTNAIGIISKSGRYGGTFAHKDIAFEFASWISLGQGKFSIFSMICFNLEISYLAPFIKGHLSRPCLKNQYIKPIPMKN